MTKEYLVLTETSFFRVFVEKDIVVYSEQVYSQALASGGSTLVGTDMAQMLKDAGWLGWVIEEIGNEDDS